MSIRYTTPLLLLCLLVCLGQTGCASKRQPPLAVPSYQWINPQQGIHLVNQRATSLDTMFGVGDLTIDLPGTTDAQGKAVKAQQLTLQVAVVALGNEHLRFRAWQKKKPVMDIAMNQQGMWVWTAPGTSDLPLSYETMKLLPAVLRGNLPGGLRVVKDGGAWVTLMENFSRPGRPVNYLLHKSTLTVRRYEFMDQQNHILEAINLENYEQIDMYPWPTQLTASSDAGSMQINFTDVQLNARLPQNAFEPLTQAAKLP